MTKLAADTQMEVIGGCHLYEENQKGEHKPLSKN